MLAEQLPPQAARDGGGDLLFVRRIGGVPAASVAKHVRSCVDDAAHGAKKTDIADAGEIEDDVVISVQYGGRASAVDYSSSSDDDRNETQRRLRRHETIGRNQKDPSAEAAATYARLEAEAKARASHDAATGRDAEAARAATPAALRGQPARHHAEEEEAAAAWGCASSSTLIGGSGVIGLLEPSSTMTTQSTR